MRGPWLIAYRDRRNGDRLTPTIEAGIRTKREAEEIARRWNESKRRSPKWLVYQAVKLPPDVVARVKELERRADALRDVEWALRREAQALVRLAVADVGEPF